MFTPKKCMHQDSFLAKGQSERKKNEKLWMNRSLSDPCIKVLKACQIIAGLNLALQLWVPFSLPVHLSLFYHYVAVNGCDVQ